MKSTILASLSVLCLLAHALSAATQDAESYFHSGARHYLATNGFAQAVTTVSNGLALYPGDPKLKKLWELLNQQQQQQQDKNDKQDQKDQKDQSKQDQQQSKDRKSKEQQKKEEQAKQEQQKKEEQQKQEQASKQDKKDGEDKKGQQASSKQDEEKEGEGQPQKAQAFRMTPQQAVQLLESLKGDEKAMIFKPVLKTNRNNRLLKDW